MAHFSQTFRHRVFIGLCILFCIAFFGILVRIIEYIKIKYSAEQQSVLTVQAIHAAVGAPLEKLTLPGNVVAWHEATLYARTNGYVINWYTDIGAHVKAGDLLAEISTPEVNAQLRQTEAQLVTAEANYQLAKITANRWKNLLKTQSVSQQETDEKVSNEQAQAAIVVSTRANRDRLRDLVSFEKITAPFDGIIMSRTTDIGRLINAGSSGSVPLFRIVQINHLRIYVRVPQIYASRIKPGLTAELYFTQHPGKLFTARLLDTAKAIDAKSRTLLIQLEADNPNNELLTGSYAEVHLLLPSLKSAVYVPVNTLIFQKHGLQVAVISDHNQAVLKSITIGRDLGNSVEVIAGLKATDKVILNPPDSLISGQKVQLVSTSRTSSNDANKL